MQARLLVLSFKCDDASHAKHDKEGREEVVKVQAVCERWLLHGIEGPVKLLGFQAKTGTRTN